LVVFVIALIAAVQGLASGSKLSGLITLVIALIALAFTS
jgi:uncharacterized membrane protein YtjA (UPF0391 family)